MKQSVAGLVLAALATVLLVACSGDREPLILHVPSQYPTIQGAVDAARPGDLVLIAPGTYVEAVRIETPDIAVRGEDRNAVVLDGEDRLSSGFTIVADGVAIENLTVHNFRQNGVIVTGTGSNGYHDQYEDDTSHVTTGADLDHVERYRVSYVTAYNNGLYGVYVFQARNGVVDHTYTSGHPDSGLYVGQCSPCNAVLTQNVAENNAIGYYGTNASGNVYVVQSVFQGNRLGIAPNSQNQELLAPQSDTYVVGNVVADNDNPNSPPINRGFYGGGIAVGGGHGNLIARNVVTGNAVYGIGIVELNPFEPEDNRVEGNVLSDNGVDLIYGPSVLVTSSAGNCFVGNEFATSLPGDIESTLPCDGAQHELAAVSLAYPDAPPGIDYRQVPVPATQTTMPGDVRLLPVRLADQPTFPDVAAIQVPRP